MVIHKIELAAKSSPVLFGLTKCMMNYTIHNAYIAKVTTENFAHL